MSAVHVQLLCSNLVQEKNGPEQLPASRVTPSPPFTTCRVDYAGPFLLKHGYTCRHQIVKAYLCVSICFSIKGGGLRCYHRGLRMPVALCFSKGKPIPHLSDNGGNFQGARSDLRALYKFLEETPTQTAITTYLLAKQVHWHATPERAPHFGGLWEAAVKSAKTHIKRVVGTQLLNFEELSTITAQVEACLNSRPLIATTSHSQDGVKVLTPAHFLIGRPICAYPEIPTTTELSLHKHWRLCQSIITHFWRLWSSEYLQQLQHLQKWRKPSSNIKVGDIVLIREDTTLTTHWPMARVLSPPRQGWTSPSRYCEDSNQHPQTTSGEALSATQRRARRIYDRSTVVQ